MSQSSTLSDAGIVRRVLSGNGDDFRVLVERYMPVAYAVAYAQTQCREDAEDIVQESFLKAYRALDSLREGAKFGSWLARIVRNTAASLLAKRKRNAETTSAQASHDEEAVVPDVETEEIRDLLRRRIERLPSKDREILLLHYYAGKTTRESAHILGITRHAAKKRLERARQTLSDKVLAELEPAMEPARVPTERAKALTAVCLASPVAWKAAAGGGTTAIAGSAAAATAGAAAAGQTLKIASGGVAVLGLMLFLLFFVLFYAVPLALRRGTGRAAYARVWVVSVAILLVAAVGAAAWDMAYVPAPVSVYEPLDTADRYNALLVKSLRVTPPAEGGSLRQGGVEVEVANTTEEEVFIGMEYESDGGRMFGGFYGSGSAIGGEVQAIPPNTETIVTFPLDIPHRFVYGGSIRIGLGRCLGSPQVGRCVWLPDNTEVIFSRTFELVPER